MNSTAFGSLVTPRGVGALSRSLGQSSRPAIGLAAQRPRGVLSLASGGMARTVRDDTFAMTPQNVLPDYLQNVLTGYDDGGAVGGEDYDDPAYLRELLGAGRPATMNDIHPEQMAMRRNPVYREMSTMPPEALEAMMGQRRMLPEDAIRAMREYKANTAVGMQDVMPAIKGAPRNAFNYATTLPLQGRPSLMEDELMTLMFPVVGRGMKAIPRLPKIARKVAGAIDMPIKGMSAKSIGRNAPAVMAFDAMFGNHRPDEEQP